MSTTTKYSSTILITGGTQGLGYHTALSLAKSQPNSLIVLASRTDPSSAASSINTKLSQQNVLFTPLDLSSLASVRDFASRWTTSAYPPISALILNAGVQFPAKEVKYTSDGIEAHFGINHVGHALLFHLLVPHLTPAAHIVVVSSGLHDAEQAKSWGFMPRYTTGDRVAYPNAADAKESGGRDRYATSKAANAIWAFALSHHVKDTPKAVLAFDPGLMFGTQFARDAGPILRWLNKWVMPRLTGLFRLLMNENINPPEEAGAKLAWLATSKEVDGVKSKYFETRKEREASKQAQDESVQEELWSWTIGKIKENEDEGRRFARVE
ncbi:NAD(P)-binding protein [Phaeosphaeriaceae sp. SRC1lsM3a]|nr:NAD(P)-binding protein [Stagonospora sp. SRC1lsM3a]